MPKDSGISLCVWVWTVHIHSTQQSHIRSIREATLDKGAGSTRKKGGDGLYHVLPSHKALVDLAKGSLRPDHLVLPNVASSRKDAPIARLKVVSPFFEAFH